MPILTQDERDLLALLDRAVTPSGRIISDPEVLRDARSLERLGLVQISDDARPGVDIQRARITNAGRAALIDHS